MLPLWVRGYPTVMVLKRAGPTSTASISSDSRVLGREFVTMNAVGLARLLMRAMSNPVIVVFRHGSVCEIRANAVIRFAVEVANLKAFGARPHKGEHDQLVDSESFVPAIFHEVDVEVTLARRFQNVLTVVRVDASLIADLIETFVSGHPSPLFTRQRGAVRSRDILIALDDRRVMCWISSHELPSSRACRMS